MKNILPFLLLLFSFDIYAGGRLFLDGGNPSYLGRGLNSKTGQLTNYCISGDRKNFSNSSLNIKTYESMSTEEILKSRNGSGSIGLDLWVFGGKAKTEFEIRHSESKLRTSFIWSIDYRYGSIGLEEPKMNHIGRVAADRSNERRLRTCGDSFISSVSLGARVYLAASISFFSEEDYRKFKTTVKFKALGGLVKKKKTFREEFRKLDMNAVLTVKAEQYGGNGSIVQLMDSSFRNHCDKSNVGQCLDKFDRLYNYIFSEQFKSRIQNIPPEELAPLSYEYYTYEESGLIDLEGSNSQSILIDDIENQLVNRIKDLESQFVLTQIRIEYDIDSPPEELFNKRESLKKMISRLRRTLNFCAAGKTSRQDCLDRVEAIRS